MKFPAESLISPEEIAAESAAATSATASDGTSSNAAPPESPSHEVSLSPQRESSDAPQQYEIPLPPAGEPLGFRMKEFARLIALGKTNGQIADAMQCTPTRVSIIRGIPGVREEAERYRDRLFEGDVAERLKELNASAFGVYERILRDPRAKDNLKLSAATWILEKTTGKATQSLDVKSSTLEGFYKLVSDLSARGESIDVTPPQIPAPRAGSEIEVEVPEHDPLQSFVDEET